MGSLRSGSYTLFEFSQEPYKGAGFYYDPGLVDAEIKVWRGCPFSVKIHLIKNESLSYRTTVMMKSDSTRHSVGLLLK